MGTPYLGELRIMSFNFAPKTWAMCNGQLLPINQNQALFSLLGTMYGGNGTVNFALPDLRTRVPAHIGSGMTQGMVLGQYSHTLTSSEMPQHQHFLLADANTAATSNSALPATNNSFGQTIGKPSQGANFTYNMYSNTISNLTTEAPASLGNAGGSQPHENRQPYLTLNICIALQGIFPSRN
jgi:microcystin-dependent protein